MKRKRILIVYHSGSGSTQLISEVLDERLSRLHEVDRLRVPARFDSHQLSNYDFLVFGFPTFYCNPSPSIAEFVDRMPFLDPPKMAFVFTTLALYAENCLRRFAQHLLRKNVVTVGYAEIRGPATDGSLLLPSSLFPFMFRYEKGVLCKIDRAVAEIEARLEVPVDRPRIPGRKWYTPLSRLGQLVLDRFGNYKYEMRILSDRCTCCGLCVDDCRRGCWVAGEGRPSFRPENCEFCLGCVHHCPAKAIVFLDMMKNRPRLDAAFYERLKEETFTGR